jgi:integrase/recombinase XerD
MAECWELGLSASAMKKTKHCHGGSKRGEGPRHLSIIKAARRSQSVERLRREYDQHLDQVAGLTEATRSVYWLFIRQFLQRRSGRRPFRLGALWAKDVNSFIQHSGPRLQCSSLHVLAAALRSFLSFLHFTGRTPVALANAVVCPAPRPRRPIPETLSQSELRRFLKSFDRTQPIGKRDLAMALCLCRLGLRAKEVTSLKLEDVDWRARTLHLQQTKTRRSRLVPLPADVARAIRSYLRAGRPPTASGLVFVQHRPPYGGADRRSGFLRAAVRGACIRAGLSHKGVHILRHTLATRLHRRGVQLKTIADLLGHVSINSTAGYVRVHLHQLRQAALPWPR